MGIWIALGLLQAAAPAASPALIDLACVMTDGSPAGTLAFHVDLSKDRFTVSRNGASPVSGVAGAFRNKLVLELPSSNPDAIPMFFINTDSGEMIEATRSGASAMTTVAVAKCTKTVAGAAQ